MTHCLPNDWCVSHESSDTMLYILLPIVVAIYIASWFILKTEKDD
jgi:hypothetical protein